MPETAPARPGPLLRLLDARPGELRAVLLAVTYHFLIFSAYFVIRPIREQMGIAGGVRNLPWMFTGTLLLMLLANPMFSRLVARLPRRRFIALTYRFFLLNLLVFYLLLEAAGDAAAVWVGRAFFLWVSVFSLFVTSIFWGFMVDLFRESQGRRLFGVIAAGGTLGAILGSTLTATLVGVVGQNALLLVSAALLEAAVRCVAALGAEAGGAGERAGETPAAAGPGAAAAGRIGGSVWAGAAHALRSPYLLGISAYMLLYTMGSTFLYLQQAAIIDRSVAAGVAQTALFARIDLTVNALTLFGQFYLAARLLRWLGVALTLALVPALSVLGFLGLGLAPTLALVVAFQVLRRSGNYAAARPAREVLYTVVPREDKYKAKSFIDTVVYRLGDQVGAWTTAALSALGLGVAGVSFVALPVSALWLAVSLWLGGRQKAMARTVEAEPAAAPAAGA